MEFESIENITFSDISLLNADFDLVSSMKFIKAFSSSWNNSLELSQTSKPKKRCNSLTKSQTVINRTSLEQFNEITEIQKELDRWGLPPAIIAKYKSKGITKMFNWQVECLGNSRVLGEYGNLIYSAPTSAGKTLVAEMLTIKTVLERQKKVIIILPFVSVVREKMFYFQNIFDESGIRVEGFMGSQAPPGGIESVHIAICTIEKANNLVNRLLENGDIEELGAVVVDELHLIGDPHRGYILELLLTKLLYISKKLGNQIQIIGMSATLPNLDLLSNWLHADLYKTEFRPIPLEERCMLAESIFDSKLEKIRELKSITELNNDKEFITQLCLETIKDGRSVLIFCPTKNWCENLAHQIATTFKNLGYSKSILGNYLREQLDGNSINEVLEQLKSSPVGLDSVLQLTISFGVAYHHAGLTMDERDIIEGGFKNNIIRVLIATSTLSSGVNLPARRVIIRSPVFNCKPLNIMTYKQMVGRAGRMGIDSEGESILICNLKEKTIAADLLKGSFKPIGSCLEGDDKLMRAVLEAVASEIVSTKNDIELYINCTLLLNSSNDEKLEQLADDTIKRLAEYELIGLQKNDDTFLYIATPLGKACLASSMSPQDGLNLFVELQKARECFVLETDLHMIYLVTPYSICNQWGDLNWLHFLSLWEGLSMAMKRVGKLVGVQESIIYSCMRNSDRMTTPAMIKKYQIYKRFYTALALQDLVNEIPLNVVADKFSCSRGMLQSLQQSAATFAGMVTAFTRQLCWKNFEILVSQFQDRLHFGIQSELLDLMKLQSLNGSRARAIYNCGIESVAQLANASVSIIENALNSAVPFQSEKIREGEHKFDADKRNDMKCVWITGKKGVTTKQAANLLISEARTYLQLELGIRDIKWKTQPSNSNIENESDKHLTPITDKSDSVSIIESSDSGNLTHESFLETSLLESSDLGQTTEKKSINLNTSDDTKTFDESSSPHILNRSNSILDSDLSKSLFEDSLEIDTQLGGILDNKIRSYEPEKNSEGSQNSIETMFASSFDFIRESPTNFQTSCKRKHSLEVEYSQNTKNVTSINRTPLKIRKIDLQFKNNEYVSYDLSSIYNKNEHFNDVLKIFQCCQDQMSFIKYTSYIMESDAFSIFLDVDKVGKQQSLIGSKMVSLSKNNEYSKLKHCSDGTIYIRGLALCLENEVFYIDFQTDQFEALSFIEKLLKDKTKKITMYDCKSSYLILKRCCKIAVKCQWEDPLIADWLLDSECLIKPLFKMADVYCSFNIDSIKNIKDNINLACLMSWIVKDVMMAVKNIIFEKHPDMLQTLEIEMKSLHVLSQCESNGILVDKESAISTLNQIKSVQNSLELNAYKLTGRRFKFTSSSEVAKVMGIYKGRKISTNKKTLEKIDNPLSQIVIYWRKLNTILTKNIFPLISKVTNESSDERIFGSYWTHTSTGRMTMQEPNLQSMPRTFEVPQEMIVKLHNNMTLSKNCHFCCRNIFSVKSGFVLISADYCQLELRLLTHLSKDQTLQRIVRSGEDIFRAIASAWKNIAEDEVDDDLRQNTKQLCYGIIYGMGIKSLAHILDMCEIEAEVFLKTFHNAYPGIKAFINITIDECRKSGYVETLHGRRRYLPSINSNNFSEKSHAERQAVNTTIQGSAADILKSAMILINENIEKTYGLSEQIKLVLLLHDELMYEVPVSLAEEFAVLFKNCLENTVQLSIPLPVKVKLGKTWGGMEEMRL